ncbi:MAG: hypothetical protein AB2693_14040, partial [Candidatus Thiodiazotropha sp.]
RIAKDLCKEIQAPSEWNDAFLAQSGFVGLVKSTNKRDTEIKPMETITISGLVRKNKETDVAVTEQSDKASSRIGVCPRVVSLTQVGKNQRVPVRIFNISAKTISIKPQTTLCELQEIKL